MTDVAFTTLIPRIQPSVPGCPYPTIKEYIRDAAIKACERSLAWRYQPSTFSLLPGVHEYAFERPTNADVHAVFGAMMNGQALDLITLDEALRRFPEWADLYSGEDADELWSETPSMAINQPEYNEALFNGTSDFVLPDSIVAEASTPRIMCMLSPDKYIVLPLPDGSTYEMRMFLALKPTRTATTIDDKIFEELEDVILHKVVEDLCVLPNVPWSNPDLAQYHSRKYHYLVHERKARANLGHVRGVMRTKIPAWA